MGYLFGFSRKQEAVLSIVLLPLVLVFALGYLVVGAVIPFATIFQAREPTGLAIYGGVRYTVAWVLKEDENPWAMLGRWLTAPFHLPACAVFDTLLLPFSIVNERRRGGIRVRAL